MNNTLPVAKLIDVQGFKTETERGESAFHKGYHRGILSLTNRISHHLSARFGFKTYPMINKRPLISFTFDDISQSAATVGSKALEAHGAHGTFYVASDLIGRHISGSQKATREEIKEIHNNGHEIGLHSHSHLPVFSYSRFGFKADLDDNKALLENFITMDKNPNFCYPYGVSSLPSKLALRGKTRSARCLWKEINHSRIDPYFLRSNLIDEAAIDISGIDRLIQETYDKNGWLIFISHCVDEAHAGLSTPLTHLNHAINKAKSLDFEIVTINQGLNRLLIP